MASKINSKFLIFLFILQNTLEINFEAESLKIHERYKGKLQVISKLEISNEEDLSIAYTPRCFRTL